MGEFSCSSFCWGQQVAHKSHIRTAYSGFRALDAWRKTRRVRTFTTFALVILGPVLALITFIVTSPLSEGASSPTFRLVLLADLIYVLAIAKLVLSQIIRLFAARRKKSAGSRLHLRLSGAFAFLALMPTVLVAVFAMLTVNLGLEGWFSERVRDVIGTSRTAAEAYQNQQRGDLQQDAVALGQFLDRSRTVDFFIDDAELQEVLFQGQSQIQRGLQEAYIINGSGEIVVRGDRSYLFDFERPNDEDIQAAARSGVRIIKDWENNEFRALIHLNSFLDRYLYVSRDVDGELLNLLDDTQETADLYDQLENDRGRLLFDFGLLYLGFAVILILASMWLGLWFAERLSRPVGRVTVAAQRVGSGNLNVRVMEEQGDDEIAQLGRYFNQMTQGLKVQRETLLHNTHQIESRRRLFDSVLSSVTSGVVGLDEGGRVTFVNRSAQRLLDWQEEQKSMALAVAVPEFGPLFEELVEGGVQVVQSEVKVTRQGRLENLLVRMTPRQSGDNRLEGYVVAFEDVTDLGSAQRMAAWGDVARRIAHEIKNPLTPIQLSAERIKRKFSRQLDEKNSEILQDMTDVIVRQTNDLRRIVDEFSKFARMPEPERREEDLGRLVQDAVLLQEAGQPDLTIRSDIATLAMPVDVDATMIGQALTNLIKNAGEAIGSLKEKGAPEGFAPEIRVSVAPCDAGFVIKIADNGIGLPEDRARLFEPYVTTRDEGTGLGLPIVKKIIEEHGGTLTLDDAPVFQGNAHHGAMATVRLAPAAPRSIAQKHMVKAGLT